MFADGTATYFIKFAAKAVGGDKPKLFISMLLAGLAVPMIARVLSMAAPEQKWLQQLGTESPLVCAMLLIGLTFAIVYVRGRALPEAVFGNLEVLSELLRRAKLGPQQEKLVWFSVVDNFRRSLDPQLGNRPDPITAMNQALQEAGATEHHVPPDGGAS